MSNSPLRADLVESIRKSTSHMHGTASDILETVILTRQILERSRGLMHRADQLLGRSGTGGAARSGQPVATPTAPGSRGW